MRILARRTVHGGPWGVWPTQHGRGGDEVSGARTVHGRPCRVRKLVELVTAYVEDELDADTRRRFDDHVGICDDCRRYLDQMRRTVALAGSLRADDIDPLMLRRLATAFRDWRDQRPPPVM